MSSSLDVRHLAAVKANSFSHFFKQFCKITDVKPANYSVNDPSFLLQLLLQQQPSFSILIHSSKKKHHRSGNFLSSFFRIQQPAYFHNSPLSSLCFYSQHGLWSFTTILCLFYLTRSISHFPQKTQIQVFAMEMHTVYLIQRNLE